MSLLHLLVEVWQGVHPFHHVVELFGRENIAIGGGKGLFRQGMNQRTVIR